MDKVKDQAKPRHRRGHTRLSSKNQATIPVEALRTAGLKPGDRLRVEAAGVGRIVLTREEDLVERHSGSLTEAYPDDYLARLRAEWP
jgi:bifunctional DNA-binding transcriptional regulator/antitoxin component of YhaV-PrlF toxin-antitoxin module